VLFSFSANSSVSSGKKHKVGCTVQHPRNKKTFCQNKNPAHIHALSFFGGRGWMSRAALLKTAHWAVFALSSATAPQLFESTRKTRSKRA